MFGSHCSFIGSQYGPRIYFPTSFGSQTIKTLTRRHTQSIPMTSICPSLRRPLLFVIEARPHATALASSIIYGRCLLQSQMTCRRSPSTAWRTPWTPSRESSVAGIRNAIVTDSVNLWCFQKTVTEVNPWRLIQDVIWNHHKCCIVVFFLWSVMEIFFITN